MWLDKCYDTTSFQLAVRLSGKFAQKKTIQNMHQRENPLDSKCCNQKYGTFVRTACVQIL